MWIKDLDKISRNWQPIIDKNYLMLLEVSDNEREFIKCPRHATGLEIYGF
jgi:hypothetical protein